MSWLLVIVLIVLPLALGFGVLTDAGLIVAPVLDRLAKRFGLQSAAKTGDEYCGKEAVVAAPLNRAALSGKVELHGSLWNARLDPSCADTHLEVGDIVVIRAVEGLTFVVAPKQGRT